MKRHKKGIALIAAIATVLTSGIFVSTPKTVHAADYSGDGYMIVEKLDFRCSNPDKNNLEIGDKYQIVVTLKNNSEETWTVDPASCMVGWKFPDYTMEDGHSPNMLYELEEGEKVVVRPGEEREAILPIEIGKFAIPGRRIFQKITIGTEEGYEILYDNQEEYQGKPILIGMISTQGNWSYDEIVHSLDYSDRCLDYAVPNAPYTDLDTPPILDMKAAKNPVEPSGTVTYELELGDYVYALPERLYVEFQDVNNTAKKVELGNKLEYSENTGMYTCTLDLGTSLSEGTYKITKVKLYDEAGNERWFWYRDNGKFEDYEHYTLEIEDLVVEKPSYTLGDINADGNINLFDLMLCLNHVSKKTLLETNEQLAAADIDENGTVNLFDLMRLLNYVSKKSSEL